MGPHAVHWEQSTGHPFSIKCFRLDQYMRIFLPATRPAQGARPSSVKPSYRRPTNSTGAVRAANLVRTEEGAITSMEEWDLATKTAVVTGSTSGIGKETAEALAALGAIVILACRNLELAQQVADEIRSKHPHAKIEVGPRLDLSSQASVRSFAKEFTSQGRPLHLLVNNAGANHHGDPWYTPEGVGGLCQVNYLGPYTLTRLLEGLLVDSAPARVVNVSSVTHRYGYVGPLSTYLTNWKQGSYYPCTKLANVLFAYELTKRLGAHGIQSCAVDPGGVASNIWKNSVFSKPPLSWVIGNLYAPARDGAAAVIHAASVPWGADRKDAQRINARWALQNGRSAKNGAALRGGGSDDRAEAQHDLRFYARGLFASPLVTSTRGVPDRSTAGKLWGTVWGLGAIVCSLLDWPIRNLSGGRLQSRALCVPSAPLSYDERLQKELWEVSAAAAGLPAEPVLKRR